MNKRAPPAAIEELTLDELSPFNCFDPEQHPEHPLATGRRRMAVEGTPLGRRIVLLLAQRVRQASRDLRRVERGKPGEYSEECVSWYRGTFNEARNAHELARRILMGREL